MKQLNIKALAENFKSRAEKDIKENNISGASVAVISTDETLYKAHFGTISAKDSTPIDNSVLFRMASMTKPVTAVAIMALYDRGLINIDDIYVMLFFRYRDGEPAFNTFACSLNLINWTHWNGEPLIKSEYDWENVHAHKPWFVRNNGKSYHYYCAVNDKNERFIALAVSD